MGNRVVYVAEIKAKHPGTPAYASIDEKTTYLTWISNFNDALQFNTRDECVKWIEDNCLEWTCEATEHMYVWGMQG
jgi:hypothetical protein